MNSTGNRGKFEAHTQYMRFGDLLAARAYTYRLWHEAYSACGVLILRYYFKRSRSLCITGANESAGNTSLEQKSGETLPDWEVMGSEPADPMKAATAQMRLVNTGLIGAQKQLSRSPSFTVRLWSSNSYSVSRSGCSSSFFAYPYVGESFTCDAPR